MSDFNLDLFDDVIEDKPSREPNNNMPFQKRYLPAKAYQEGRSYQGYSHKPVKIPPRPEGRQIDTYSELWRAECMVREVAQMPMDKRFEFLTLWERKHAPESYHKLARQLEQIAIKGYLKEEDL